MTDAGTPAYCRRCGEPLSRGVIASRQRACCLNATPIAGVCPTHGPVGPHHAVDEPSGGDDAGSSEGGGKQ
ncbi:hypothetical protein [Halorubrum depositum]|uniref:hypothetical protein n=1 Tax=Halorubrum depositum TaxID=2583992 RepID=UPI0011A4AA56|nr:hypothetical protein [Halorubrum depositum]